MMMMMKKKKMDVCLEYEEFRLFEFEERNYEELEREWAVLKYFILVSEQRDSRGRVSTRL